MKANQTNGVLTFPNSAPGKSVRVDIIYYNSLLVRLK